MKKLFPILALLTLVLAACIPIVEEEQLDAKTQDSAAAGPNAVEVMTDADLVITNARLFDGTGDEVVENATIVVSGNQITAVSTGDADVEGATIIDAEGKTVMPGLIDGHVHVFFDATATGIEFPKSQAELDAYIETRLQEKFDDFLEYGFTSILSPGDSWPTIVNVRDRVAAGEIRGPRMFVSGGIFTAPGGHPAEGIICGGNEFCTEHVAVEVDSEESAREWVRTYAESGVDLLKITYVEPNEEPLGPKLEPEVMVAIIDEAHQQGIRALVHAWDAADVNELVDWGIDGFVHPFGITLDEDGSLLKRAGEKGLAIPSTFARDAFFAGGASNPASDITLANVRTAMSYGSPVVFGSDLPGIPTETVLNVVLTAMSNLGLSNAQILQAATRDTAQSLLAQADLGTIQPGNLADIIIIDGDPLADLNDLFKVEVVIKDGQIMVDKR